MCRLTAKRWCTTQRSARGDDDIWTLPLTGDRTPSPFAESRFEEWAVRFSPDGHWLAFTSDDSGRTEVYMAPSRIQPPAEGGPYRPAEAGRPDGVVMAGSCPILSRETNI